MFSTLVAVTDVLGRVNIASRTDRAHIQSGKGDSEHLNQSLVLPSSAVEKDEGALFR